MRKKGTAFPSRPDPFSFFFLSALLGLVFFRLFLAFYLPDGASTKDQDFKLYIYGWFFSPLSGLLFVALLEKIRLRWFSGGSPFYLIFIFLNFSFLLFLLHPHQWGVRGMFLLVIFSFLNFLALGLSRATKEFKRDGAYPLFLSLIALFLSWFFSLSDGWFRRFSEWSVFDYAFLAVVVWVFHFGIVSGAKIKKKSSFSKHFKGWPGKIYFFYFFAFFLIGYMTIDPYFRVNAYHSAFYLAPLADMKAGKSLLVDVNAQYGVLVFYFLKAIFNFFPMGYTSFAFWGEVMIVVQYFLFYFIARQLLKSEVLAFFSLGTLLLVNHFASKITDPAFVPSPGPLRFGFIYLLMTLIILRNKIPKKINLFYRLESLVVASAFFWSFEVCVYTVPPYLGLLLFESLEVKAGMVRLEGGVLLKRLKELLGFILLIAGYLYWDIFSRSGTLPHWSYYFEYVFLYKGGFGLLPMEGMGYWWFMFGILYFSFFSVLGIFYGRDQKNPNPPHFNAIVLLTFYGITQFLYFIGRSHPINLLNVSMPSLLLFIYWLFYLRCFDPPGVPRVLKTYGYSLAIVMMGIYLQPVLSPTMMNILDRAMPVSEWLIRNGRAVRDIPKFDHFARKADETMRKYSGEQKHLAYFFGLDGMDVSIYAGRVKKYPYNDLEQARACVPVLRRIAGFDPVLKPGEFVYFNKDSLITFEVMILEQIFKKYEMRLVEKGPEISVFQVVGTK